MMVSFASFRLRGVGMSMNYPIVAAQWWGPLAEKVLEEEGLPYDSWTEQKLTDFFQVETKGRIAKTAG